MADAATIARLLNIPQVVKPVENHKIDYSAECAELLRITGFDMPLNDQPIIFLERAWSTLPRTSYSVVGLAADEKYYSYKHEDWAGTLDVEWEYADRWQAQNMVDWARKQNNNPRLTRHGAGSIFWHFASRIQMVMAGFKKRGTYDELVAAGAFVGDIDLAEQGKPLLPAFETLMSSKLPPSAVVFSGGGLQPVWFTKEPIMVTDRASAVDYRKLSRGLIYGLYGETDLEFDSSVAEPTRMTRLPGFVNRKPKRNGAIAQLVWFNPDGYTEAQIRSVAIIKEPAPRVYVEGFSPSSDNIYYVEQDFIKYMVHRVPGEQAHFHNTRKHISCMAAEAGIPKEIFSPLFYDVVRKWPGSTVRDDQIQGVVDWAYLNISFMGYEQGTWPVVVTRDGFEIKVDPEAEKKLRKRQVLLDVPAHNPDYMPVRELREAQAEWIKWYYDLKERNMATVGLLQTSPGTGKTTELLAEIVRRVDRLIQQGYTPRDKKNLALYLGQFKVGWPGEKTNGHLVPDGYAWLLDLFKDTDIDPLRHRNMFGFFMARSDDPNSKGYCEKHAEATVLGGKGHNVVSELCNTCPALLRCKEKGYLAQFKAMENYWIVVGTHHHGMMAQELVSARKHIIFDESPLNIVMRRVVLSTDDLTIKNVATFLEDQHEEDVALLKRFIDAVRNVILSNTPKSGRYAKFDPMHINSSYLKLGGHWLISNLAKAIGEQQLEKALDLDKKIIRNVNGVDTSTLEEISDSQPNYLAHLINVLKYECEHHYKEGHNRWNSRLIPYGNQLLIFPMDAFKFTKNTKVVVADATGLPHYYPVAFTDQHTETDKETGVKHKRPRPRQLKTFSTQLTPKAHITQYTGTENTKTSLFTAIEDVEKIEIEKPELVLNLINDQPKVGYTFNDTLKLAEALREQKNSALALLITITHQLAIRHKGNLLIIMYKKLITDSTDDSSTASTLFMRWIRASNIISENNVQWFYNLRGKNDWRHCEACLVVGTPRMQEDELLINAQVLHWQEDRPVQPEREKQVVPYMGHVTPEGKALGYEYWGYADPLVNRLYLQSIQAELRQCMDRIRPNSSSTARYIYVATEFPCADHVDEFQSWSETFVNIVVNNALERCRLAPKPESELINDIAKEADCTEPTARKHYKQELETGKSFIDGKAWLDIFDILLAPKGSYVVVPKGTSIPDEIGLNKVEYVMAWFQKNPSCAVSINKAMKAFLDQYPDHDQPSRWVFQKALEQWRMRGSNDLI